LEEMASATLHGQAGLEELYLTNQCDINEIALIGAKANLKYLPVSETGIDAKALIHARNSEDALSVSAESEKPSSGSLPTFTFFYRYASPKYFFLFPCSHAAMRYCANPSAALILSASSFSPFFFGSRFSYDKFTGAFEDASEFEMCSYKPLRELEFPECAACLHTARREEFNVPYWIKSNGKVVGFAKEGREFHVGDYVFIRPGGQDTPYDVAVIVAIPPNQPKETSIWKAESAGGKATASSTKTNKVDASFFGSAKSKAKKEKASADVEMDGEDDENDEDDGEVPVVQMADVEPGHDLRVRVRYLDRWDAGRIYTLEQPRLERDEQRLVLTNKLSDVTLNLIEGWCEVRHGSEVDADATMRRRSNFFYFREMHKEGIISKEKAEAVIGVPRCLVCEKQSEIVRADEEKVVKEVKKLVGLDIFSGCGGLTLGLDSAGVVNTRHAIEWDGSAATTFSSVSFISFSFTRHLPLADRRLFFFFFFFWFTGRISPTRRFIMPTPIFCCRERLR
jgi:hypothetical protein